MVQSNTEQADPVSSQETAGVAAPKIDDVLDNFANNVRNAMADACAKTAEIHFIKGPIAVGYYHDGYNAAVRDIAAKIRELRI